MATTCEHHWLEGNEFCVHCGQSRVTTTRTTTVQRYGFIFDNPAAGIQIGVKEDGEFNDHADYAALEKKYEELKDELSAQAERADDHFASVLADVEAKNLSDREAYAREKVREAVGKIAIPQVPMIHEATKNTLRWCELELDRIKAKVLEEMG